jgi:hypothetical protein
LGSLPSGSIYLRAVMSMNCIENAEGCKRSQPWRSFYPAISLPDEVFDRRFNSFETSFAMFSLH